MLVPLLLAAAVAPPHVQPPSPPVFPAFRAQLFTPLSPGIARLLGEPAVRTGRGRPLLRLPGVTIASPAGFRVL